jgi:nucleolar protein 4
MVNMAPSNPSAAAKTVFVRFLPSSANIRRHHLEDLFSQIGPIKKSSVIVPKADKKETAISSSYGFIKYISAEDAQKAAEKLNRATLRISAAEKIELRVERASDVAHGKKASDKKAHDEKKNDQAAAPNNSSKSSSSSSPKSPPEEASAPDAISHKKTSRLIVRNLSFYAKESHIRKALESFGPIEDIHLPTVSDKSDNKKGQKTFHRGFGFVTFVNVKDAQKCLEAKEVEIYKRKVQIAKALHKAGYDKRAELERGEQKKDSKGADNKPAVPKEDEWHTKSIENDSAKDADSEEEEAGQNSGSDESSSEDDDDDQSASDEDPEDEDSIEADGKAKTRETATKDESAVAEKRSLFLRNLPFDVTRHDVFEAFRRFGRINGIYIVKDKQSGLPRGTAFLSYETQVGALRALSAAGTDSFKSQREASEVTHADAAHDTAPKSETAVAEEGGISLRGRRLLVNIAVERDTASTLTMDKKADQGKIVGKDRRNLYLKVEGRVDNDGENALWDQLPEQDKLKRQKAWSDKNTKLRSPLFFISATRLSLRNLAKDVDEGGLKKLIVNGVKRGMEKKLVTAEDQIANWRAAGETTTREILEKVDSLADKDEVVPVFDDQNVRKFIPSVFLERDFSSNKKDVAPSRGFGFVDFLHHAHALACVRELNNNTSYSEEYVAGGRKAMAVKGKRHKKRKSEEDGGEGKIPRLIVDFCVENRAKARKQTEHKAQQRANAIKQKIDHKEKSEEEKKDKQSRGQRQRERKRERPEGGLLDSAQADKVTKAPVEPSVQDTKPKIVPKAAKPSKKKRKVDKDEEKFSELLDTYKESFLPESEATEKSATSSKSPKKRWFEE